MYSLVYFFTVYYIAKFHHLYVTFDSSHGANIGFEP